MTTHEIARILLERPDGKLTISIDTGQDENDVFSRAFGEFYVGWQPDTNPDNTVLLFEGATNT
jgi:hypothetical protein